MSAVSDLHVIKLDSGGSFVRSDAFAILADQCLVC